MLKGCCRRTARIWIVRLGCAALGLAGSPAAAFAREAPAEAAAPPAAPTPEKDLTYLLGRWDIVATTPGTGESARFTYDVRPFLGVWISGWGRSEKPGEESRDIWGRDQASGELMRIIFNDGGTYAIVRSPGWQGRKLVLEGDARSASGVVRVRETIERLSDNQFVATWEAYRKGSWSAYSVERVTRRTGPDPQRSLG